MAAKKHRGQKNGGGNRANLGFEEKLWQTADASAIWKNLKELGYGC